MATPLFFFVQSKGTSKLSISQKKKCISFQITKKHIQRWKSFREPVVLTIYDANTEIVYWEIIQEFLKKYPEVLETKNSKISVKIPLTNQLDKFGLNSVKEHTIQYYKQLDQRQKAVDSLLGYIEEQLQVKVFYDPQLHVLIPLANPFDEEGKKNNKITLNWKAGFIGLELFEHFKFFQGEEEEVKKLEEEFNAYWWQGMLKALKKWEPTENSPDWYKAWRQSMEEE